MGPRAASPLVSAADALAARLLRGLPERLAHVRTAAAVARRVSPLIPGCDPEVVEAAALLHDVGYSQAAHRTGFHPVDGAVLLEWWDWPDRIVRHVAHHSLAGLAVPDHRSAAELARFVPVVGPEADVIAYADLVSGRDGTGSTPGDRVDEMRARHEVSSVVPSLAREARYAQLLAVGTRIAAAVAARGGTPVTLLPRPMPPTTRAAAPGTPGLRSRPA